MGKGLKVNSIIKPILLVFLLAASSLQNAFASHSYEPVTFETETLVDSGKRVEGRLAIPENAGGPVPAVVVIHNAGGLDDRTGDDYVEDLHQAGIATLQLKLFDRGGAPRGSTKPHWPHLFGSLIYLSKHPKIDKDRIGVMGFSYGGMLSVVAASKMLSEQYAGDEYKYSAHLPFYTICWILEAAAQQKGRYSKIPKFWHTTTGGPIHFLAGAKDEYDNDPQMCRKFADVLPEEVRRTIDVTVYPDVGHGWDTHEDREYYSGVAGQGDGSNIKHYRNDETAMKSRQFAVDFFTKNL